MRNLSPAQLRNLEKGKSYRWQKGRSGNPSGRHRKNLQERELQKAEMVLLAWERELVPSRLIAPGDLAPATSAPCTSPEPPVIRPEDWLALANASTPETRQRDTWKQMVDWDRLDR
jgi:hypothetical protein